MIEPFVAPSAGLAVTAVYRRGVRVADGMAPVMAAAQRPLYAAMAKRAAAVVVWAAASGSPAQMAMATKIRILLGDLVAAVVSSFIVTPLTQIVDVAVSQSASGQASVAGGLIQGVKSWVTQPLHMLGQPAFKLCWFVYICTYAGANIIEDICVLFLDISPVMPKFFGVTLCNMLACMYKARHPTPPHHGCCLPSAGSDPR